MQWLLRLTEIGREAQLFFALCENAITSIAAKLTWMCRARILFHADFALLRLL